MLIIENACNKLDGIEGFRPHRLTKDEARENVDSSLLLLRYTTIISCCLALCSYLSKTFEAVANVIHGCQPPSILTTSPSPPLQADQNGKQAIRSSSLNGTDIWIFS